MYARVCGVGTESYSPYESIPTEVPGKERRIAAHFVAAVSHCTTVTVTLLPFNSPSNTPLLVGRPPPFL